MFDYWLIRVTIVSRLTHLTLISIASDSLKYSSSIFDSSSNLDTSERTSRIHKKNKIGVISDDMQICHSRYLYEYKFIK